jgi:ketosteroid isomerase-like protein
MWKHAITSVLVSCASAACAPGAPPARVEARQGESEIYAMTQQLLDAFATGDKAVWDRYTDGALVYVNENDQVRTKAQFLAELEPLPSGFRGTARLTEPQFTRVGEVAVVTYIIDETEVAYGQTVHARYRATDTWRPTPNGYRLLASEVYAVPRDPPAIQLSDAALDEYVASYRLDPRTTLRLRRDGTRLIAERAGHPPQAWLTEARDVFFAPGFPRTRRMFTRDANGRVKGFADRREGEDLVWVREDGIP